MKNLTSLLAATLCAVTAFAQDPGDRKAPRPAGETPFDPAEAEALLAPGEASVTGRIYAITSAKKAIIKAFQQREYGKNTMVHLFPMTKHVQSLADENPGRQLFFALLSKLDPSSEVWTARAITDEGGNFKFRALKPGRYMLVATIPYKASVVTRTDTGMVNTTATFMNGWPVSFNSERIYSYGPSHKIDLDHNVVRIVTVRGDTPLTNLGDLD